MHSCTDARSSFQEVEGLSALQSSLRFIPHVIMGVAVNIITGFLISRVKVRTLAVVSALISMVAAPLMATVDVGQNYWLAPFWAMFLSPVNPDGMSPVRRCKQTLTLYSPVHCIESRHLELVPARASVARGRCVQRNIAVW